jgi:hypothetical protein
MASKRPGDCLKRDNDKEIKVIDMTENDAESIKNIDHRELKSIEEISLFASKPYEEHLKMGTVYLASVLRLLLGAKLNGASLLTKEV